ncbi:MAG: phenylalanine--tRNA ligase subunit alpha [Candidatus Omnitrophica bacterium CG11_big_fil_rev_8_21_14_0_20_42_13]|uniref:Phenylalanine--tRNA ligase alpha subunit n=1 Tax=Candidatus Ghiorseimicrobium undicola TaxID=1974746 RepID=A0A2H0M0B6_9BACT|nr:MAG: phenylalanine--tRNA ligase subunit alpha [Candidatus Omnitrophica bacterium CG11_big_fil_rev_8_21_14_0_20_42_13]
MSIINTGDIQKKAEQAIGACSGLARLEEIRIEYLGRQGLIAGLFAKIKELPGDERASFGSALNNLKKSLELLIEEKRGLLKKVEFDRRALDPSMPGVAVESGGIHILSKTIKEVCAIFTSMGFTVLEGPEIETEYNNFTGLNIPLEHPSRDAFDTFYLKPAIPFRAQARNQPPETSREKLLLRSHTSPVQIRAMKSLKPPLAVVVPGKVYRPDATDASHSFMFHQVEGFLVDENVRFSDLKGVLDAFVKRLFSSAGGEVRTRFRPHFFPFTEPSAEVDVSCIICKEHKKHCSVCGGKGWLEILGSGMIHPNVFRHVGYNHKKYSGFAFGMGIERIAMLKYRINDIRIFFENDLRFLKQF